MAINTGPADVANAGIRRLDPAKYTDLASYINEVNKPDNRDLLVKTYGNQGITGFLKLTGAVKSAGTAEEVQWWEEQRLHPKASFTTAAASAAGAAKASQTITVSAASSEPAANTATVLVREGDILLVGDDNDIRVYVHNVVKTGTGHNAIHKFDITPLDNSTLPAIASGTAKSFPIIGNMFAAGTDQQSEYIESNVVKRTNGYNIIKEIYKVTGSQATNIGWINLGGGDYRWYIKSEQDTRQRFLDKREMMMLLGQKTSSTNTAFDNISGSEGYFDAVETRGISANDYISTFGEVDELIIELDKQGAGPEYAFYCNRTQDLKIDDMLAKGLSPANSMTAGVAAQFGAFNNNKDSAIELGFRSFGRGGYTFHKHDWKLLNEPTLLGASGSDKGYVGVMVPMSTVVDPKSGDRNPSLEMNYKSSNGYSRELEHWMTGSILGATNDTKDLVQFNYRSECNLVTRAANRHVILKKS